MIAYPRSVSAQLLDYDGTPVAGDPLENAFGIVFYDEWDGPGTGSCSLSLSEAGSAQLLPGRYVDCLVEGTSRFTFIIEGNPEYRVIQRGEEHDQVVSVRGRGWAAMLDLAIVYPEYSLQTSLETTWRIFSFASILFPNAGSWGAAVEQAEYLDGVIEADCYGHWQQAPDGLAYPAPIGFPWTTNPFNLVAGAKTANYVDTWWLRTADQPNYVSTGYYFFRNTFTLAEFSPVLFTCTGDNYFTLFIQGVPILGESLTNADHWMWQGWKQHQIWLPAGTYTVAAAVYNVSFADMGAGAPVFSPPCPAEGWAGGDRYENPGGLLCAIYIDGDPVTPPTYILTSDATWVSHYEADTWPGWTPGQIIQQLIDESVARGGLTIFDPTHPWDDNDDSDGDAWRPYDATVTRPDIALFSIEVGSTIMQALQSMHEQGYIHWHMRPGTPILDVYRGRLPTPVSSATLAHGVNLGALERNATAPYANALLVQWEGGYEVVDDAAAIIARGDRVEDVLASDAPSAEEAILQGQNELAIRAQQGFPAVVAVIEPRSAADCPYEAFQVGDYVTSPAAGGGTEVIRCLSIRCQQDAEGYAVWTTELNARLDVPERKTAQLLQQIGGRNQVVRGTVT